MRHQVVEDGEGVGLHDQLVVFGPESSRHLPSVGLLVESRVLEADRERLERPRRVARGEGDDGARIRAPAQEGPEGNIADQVLAHGFVQQVPQLLHDRGLPEAVVGLELQVPVRPDLRRPIGPGQEDVAGRELAYAGHDAFRLRGRQEAKQVVDGSPVELALDVRKLQERLELGSEQEPPVDFGVVEGLDPQPVARQQESLPALVPERQREHSRHLLHAPGAVVFVEMHDRLRIGRREEDVSAPLQALPEALEVVDLSVEDHPDRAVLVAQRLVPRAEVDDAQAAHSEARTAGQVYPLVVRAAVDQGLAHALDLLPVDGAPFDTEDSCDPAHGAAPRSPW